MKAEQREELRRLADQCICHPVSRGVREVEQAGEAIKDLLDALEAAEKALAQPAHEAEPVYQVKQSVGASVWADASKDEFIEAVRHDLKRRILYTTPQQSQPLTDEQIKGLLFTAMGDKWVKIPTGWLRFVCLIEAAHGIKGVTE